MEIREKQYGYIANLKWPLLEADFKTSVCNVIFYAVILRKFLQDKFNIVIGIEDYMPLLQ
jgi:hypothetical protein